MAAEFQADYPRYLIEKLEAKKIGELGSTVSSLCYPFQVAGTHDTFRPLAAYEDGLPSQPMHRENYFYDAGNGLIIFRGQEPWFRLDVFADAFFQAIRLRGPWYHTDCRRRGCQRTGPSRHGKKNYLASTVNTFRPLAAYEDGLPSQPMHRENYFYDAGNGLIIFRGQEPWFRLDVFADAFFQAIRDLGIIQTAAVEGVNGPVPPDMERRITCVYSKSEMRKTLDRYGVQFSSYGSDGRRGPTIAMALVTWGHYNYSDLEIFRMGAMAPMYPFVTADNEQVGISRDHRSFYDIMRRLKAMFKLDIDLAELETLGKTESEELQSRLDKISSTNPEAKKIIEDARTDYGFTPFEEPVDLEPSLDKTLEDILRNMPE